MSQLYLSIRDLPDGALNDMVARPFKWDNEVIWPITSQWLKQFKKEEHWKWLIRALSDPAGIIRENIIRFHESLRLPEDYDGLVIIDQEAIAHWAGPYDRNIGFVSQEEFYNLEVGSPEFHEANEKLTSIYNEFQRAVKNIWPKCKVAQYNCPARFGMAYEYGEEYIEQCFEATYYADVILLHAYHLNAGDGRNKIEREMERSLEGIREIAGNRPIMAVDWIEEKGPNSPFLTDETFERKLKFCREAEIDYCILGGERHVVDNPPKFTQALSNWKSIALKPNTRA